MMMPPLKIRLAAAICGIALSCAAQATTTTLTDLDAGAAAAFAYTGTNLGTTFDDTLNFTLNGPSAWQATGSVDSSFSGLKLFGLTLGQGVTSLTVSIFSNTYSTSLGTFALGSKAIEIDIPLTSLAAGSYSARIFGTAKDATLIAGHPSYTFSLQAAPVPEPETYAMLLAGLGLVGAMARRRQRR